MMAGGLSENPWPVLDSTRFRIIGAEDQALDAEQRNRGGAERARLKGHIKPATLQKFPTTPLRRRPERQQLGMRGRIGACLHLVAGGSEHGARGIDDDCADRHFAAASGGLGLGEGLAHRGHIRSLALRAG